MNGTTLKKKESYMKSYLLAFSLVSLFVVSTSYGRMDSRYGKDGTNGRAGIDVTNGTPGRDGMDGGTGSSGVPGETGEDGTTGAPGETGPQGPQGIPGQDGEDGQTGATGQEGPQGPAGADGATGPSGPTGERTPITVTITRVSKGTYVINCSDTCVVVDKTKGDKPKGDKHD